MFVFVVWQINCPNLWVRSLTSVRCLTTKATSEVCPKSTIRSLKIDVLSQQSEVWCMKSDEIWSLMSDVSPKTVWIKSKVWSTTYVCSKPGVQKRKSEVQSMSKVQNPSLKPKSEVWLSFYTLKKQLICGSCFEFYTQLCTDISSPLNLISWTGAIYPPYWHICYHCIEATIWSGNEKCHKWGWLYNTGSGGQCKKTDSTLRSWHPCLPLLLNFSKLDPFVCLFGGGGFNYIFFENRVGTGGH